MIRRKEVSEEKATEARILLYRAVGRERGKISEQRP